MTTHNDTICTKYNEPVLPDEQGNCSLCSAKLINPCFISTQEYHRIQLDRLGELGTVKPCIKITMGKDSTNYLALNDGDYANIIAVLLDESTDHN